MEGGREGGLMLVITDYGLLTVMGLVTVNCAVLISVAIYLSKLYLCLPPLVYRFAVREWRGRGRER